MEGNLISAGMRKSNELWWEGQGQKDSPELAGNYQGHNRTKVEGQEQNFLMVHKTRNRTAENERK